MHSKVRIWWAEGVSLLLSWGEEPVGWGEDCGVGGLENDDDMLAGWRDARPLGSSIL